MPEKNVKQLKSAMRFGIVLIVAIILAVYGSAWGGDLVRYAELGDFKLENGLTIRSCRVAYRTLGSLNRDKSNAVLIPTWLAGTTQELIDLGIIGPGKMIDSTKYYIIAVDSFGNGVSSSPSNSSVQPDRTFPDFSIRDMVAAQHILLTGHLNIEHVRAVVGISMGGLQAFQWMVSYPAFMDKVIPIVGSPWLTSNDLLIWTGELGIINAVQGCKSNNDTAMKTLSTFHTLLVWTPRFRVANTKPGAIPDFLAGLEKSFAKYDATNWARQVKAIKDHDILQKFDGSAEKAASAVQAKILVITSAQDQIVYPETAKTFARLLKSETAELTGDCGHLAFLCELDKLRTIVNGFLEKGN